jgi:glyoxylase-like metal-dependent hydrolase (beta-lactamase superfamily II)
MLIMAVLVLGLALAQAQSSAPSPLAREIAPETYLVPGAMLPDRGPDGNTIIVLAPSGAIVIDTGRHPWHSDGILDFVASRRLPVAVVVNTHWHLDHSSGNGRVKKAHPAAKVYTTSAVDRALAPGGFLARNVAAARERGPDPKASETRREETALFLATMEASATLRPDVVVERSSDMNLAGRPVSVHVAMDAVTDADLWLYDTATSVAVVGDLVTLPAPFFETACPARWQAALTRGDFDSYRRAFGRFLACVSGDSTAAACADGWTRDVGSLVSTDDDRREATAYATYYVDFLRKNGQAGPDCRVK